MHKTVPTLTKASTTLKISLLAAVFALASGCAAPPAKASAPGASTSGPSAAGKTRVADSDYPSRPEVRQFIATMGERHGFDTASLDTVFSKVSRNDDVIRLMTPAPPTFKRSWRNYRARFIDNTRIAAGVGFWNTHAQAVSHASRQYGVSEEIIVSIIGVETVFGRVTGDFRVIDALATLAFDYPRRADYFRGELEQFLLLAREQGTSPFAAHGSYAGAMGLPQFMPTSIRQWAVDFDGDGRIDLHGSPADAIGSVANFLAQHGWAQGLPPRYRAIVPSPDRASPLIEAGITPKFTIAELREHGVDSRDPVPVDAGLALIELVNGDNPPDYWLGGQNFYVITRYNRSSFY
ncbi:MAG TPA: lytic murein transglycosylase B, partial [Burkholderiaceae bacterium]|nr:lytic murein transglycosylase B [Burkholderiaceae bacterium]